MILPNEKSSVSFRPGVAPEEEKKTTDSEQWLIMMMVTMICIRERETPSLQTRVSAPKLREATIEAGKTDPGAQKRKLVS